MSVASDSNSSNNSLIQISKQKTSNRIAELKEELRILNEKSLNSKVIQTTPKKTKKIQNATIDSKKIHKPPIPKEKGKNYYDIPRTLHIRKMTWNGYVESLRHLCEEYLSEVAKTMMFKDIKTKLINKTIRKFKDQNERFPQTMGDWALREMIRRWVNNYREYNKEPDKSSKTLKSRKHKKSRNSMELESTSYNNHTSDVEESQNNSGDFTSIETLHSDHKNDAEQDDPKLESNNMTTNELQDITQQIEELMNKQKKYTSNLYLQSEQDIPKENSHLSDKIIDIQDDDKNDEISLKRKNPEDSSVTLTNNSSDNKLVDPTSKCKRKRSNSTQIESTSANNDLKKQRTRRST
ncbi:hypothetical protein RhiirA1_447892 [Rhizophagus irregularis]|uniref:Uncharacterized protein n=1 Tax=Rhizophagus irregularis TaxID=588596 RepID=A0A2N0SKZ8_9GLOM|nr:hypothetical protein RhiirA1_447892 [Rhizophagus irregularis]